MTAKTIKRRVQISRFPRNVSFTVSTVKFNYLACGLRKGDLKMSQKHDLQGIRAAWRITGTVEFEQTQLGVVEATEIARCLNASLWNRFQDK